MKLSVKHNTVILTIGIKYSVRDLLCDIICLIFRVAICITYGNDVIAPSGISSLQQAVNSILKPSFK